MLISQRRREPSARRAIQKSDLDHIRYDALFDRVFLFVNGSGNRAEADGSTTKLLGNRQQSSSVHLVATGSIDCHPVPSVTRDRLPDASVVIDFSVLAR